MDAIQVEEDGFYQKLTDSGLGAFWKVIPNITKKKPAALTWKWEEVLPLLQQSGDIVRPGSGAERRVIIYSNPDNPASTTSTLTASVQLVLPGETASSHRHTMAAIRFIISGSGAFTTVEGERIYVEPGDLILTPSWSWHDHGNETSEPVIWLDGLDAPMVRALQADAFEPDAAKQQRVVKGNDYTRGRLGSAFLKPKAAVFTEPALPVIYKWTDVYKELQLQVKDRNWEDPFDGIMMEYCNPVTGGSTLPTLSCCIQLLYPGQVTRTHRHTGSVIYYAVKGQGSMVIEDERVNWQEGDVIALPSWAWHSHINDSKEESILFSYTDSAVLEKIGLYRTEAR